MVNISRFTYHKCFVSLRCECHKSCGSPRKSRKYPPPAGTAFLIVLPFESYDFTGLSSRLAAVSGIRPPGLSRPDSFVSILQVEERPVRDSPPRQARPQA